MKYINQYRIVSAMSVLLVGTLLLQSCKEDSVTPAQTVQALLISTAWSSDDVTVDGTDQNDLFTGLKITFDNDGYTSVNGGVVWPASGTWSFTDDTATAFTRQDGIIVTIDEITAESLTLSLPWTETTLDGGRVNSTKGKYKFKFKK